MANERVLERLEAVAQSAVQHGQVLAVMALGSAGVERDRLDEYSDIDVWVIVEDGSKQRFVADLGWLGLAYRLGYTFKNSPSGYGVLFEDGIFAELAIFEVADLAALPFGEARIIWKAPGVSDAIRLPPPQPARTERPADDMLGEALGNLYVGLGRFYRGEKLSAMRFVQVYAVDQLLQLAQLIESEQPGTRDPFSPERRVELRFPVTAGALAHMMQGYERTPESAQAILQFLDTHFQVDARMKQAILERLAEHGAARSSNVG